MAIVIGKAEMVGKVVYHTSEAARSELKAKIKELL